MKLIDAVDWDEVKETAKFYYTDSTTTLNLYPALIISLLLLFCELSEFYYKLVLIAPTLSLCLPICMILFSAKQTYIS